MKNKHVYQIYFLLTFFLLFQCSLIDEAESCNLVVRWEKIQDANGLSPNPSVIQTVDNNFLIVGESYSSGKHGFWITKIDNNGRELFQKVFTVTEDITDFGVNALVNAENKNILVLGHQFSCGYKMWLCKLDKKGNQIFKKIYSAKKSLSPQSIICSGDGHYIITGTQDFRNVINIKIDSKGNKIWERIYENDSIESIALSVAMNSGNILVASVVGNLSKFGTGDSKIKLTKYDPRGTKIGDIVFPGRIVGVNHTITNDITRKYFFLSYDSPALPKGDVCKTSNLTDNEINVIKVDSNLGKIWNKSYGKKMILIFPPLIGRIEKNYILAGSGNLSKRGIEPPWLYILDENGKKICELLLKNHMNFSPNAVVTNNTGFLLIGTEMPLGESSNSKIVIINIRYE